MQTQTTSRHHLIAAPARLRDALRARLRPRPLDLALANGVPPESNPALASRARTLSRFSRRRALADAIWELIDDRRRGYLRVRPIAGRIAAASDELSTLADALSQPRPVHSRGVAQARLLLSDGTGPLYNPRSDASVRERAAAAAASLSLS